jgi:xylulokinase
VFLEPVDYLNLRLTGKVSASYDSIAAHWVTDNRNVDAVDYDDKLLEWTGLDRARPGSTGLDRARLPDLVALGSLVGEVTDRAAADLGIPAGLAGRYLIADEHETAGTCLTFLRDNLALAPDFDTMNAMVERVPAGSGRVLFTPWLNGERSPVDDHTVRGGFHNLSLGTTCDQVVRAVFEGVALNSRWLLDAVEKFAGRRLDSLAFVGGGANSDPWSKIHADVLGREIRQVADPVLANVRGAGLLTLRALDRITLADVPGMVEIKRTYEPDPANTAEYDLLMAELVTLYKQTKGIFKRLNRF